MAGYPDYRAPYAAHAQRPLTHHSFAPSTHNWVHSQQRHPAGAPPPQPVKYPTPVRALRPLPNPHEPKARPLRVVNNLDPEPRSLNEGDASGTGTSDVDSSGFARAPKKKGALDRWVKGIRRLPQNLFRSKLASQKSTTYATASEGINSPSATDFTGNTLPGYTSKPTSPLAPHVRPAVQQMQHFQEQYQSQVAPKSQLAAASSYPGRSTPMPDVVRLSTASSQNPNSRRHNPSYRVTPPSDEFLHEQFYNAPLSNNPAAEADREGASIYGTPRAERATVMLYSNSQDNRRSQTFSQHQPWTNHPTPHPTPPPPVGPSRQLTASPGLSYVSEEEPPPVLIPERTISHHSSFRAPAPPPIEIPHGYTDSMRRVSYASQAPRRETPPASLIPGAFPTSEASSVPIFQSAASSTHMDVTYAAGTSMPYITPDPSPPERENPNPIATPAPAEAMSPVSMHQVPTADYRKMTLSPSPASNLSLSSGGYVSAADNATSTSGYYDPSFASQLNMNPFERFFRTLYHMPWVSHARVTADYAPGEGIGRKPARKIKPMTSWYRGFGQGRAKEGDRRGSGGSLDLLSSGTASPRMSLGASAALLMDDGAASAMAAGNALQMSEVNSNAHRRESATVAKQKHVRDSERRSRAQGRRKAATWLDGKYDGGRRARSRRDRDDHHHQESTSNHYSEHQAHQNAPSPLIPPIYPFAFPSYSYGGFPAYQMSLPNSDAQTSQPGPAVGDGANPPIERPRGPRPLVQQQPFMYAVPPQGMYGLGTYPTQMVATSQQPVYFLPPAALTSPALQQTASDSGNVDAQGNAGLAPPQAQPLRHQISSPTLMYLQPIPGAF